MNKNNNTELKVLLIIALVMVAIEIISGIICGEPDGSLVSFNALLALLSLSYVASTIAFIKNYDNFYTCETSKYCYKIFKNFYITILIIFYVAMSIANIVVIVSVLERAEYSWYGAYIIPAIEAGCIILTLPTKLIFSKYNLKLLNTEYLHQINKKLDNINTKSKVEDTL